MKDQTMTNPTRGNQPFGYAPPAPAKRSFWTGLPGIFTMIGGGGLLLLVVGFGFLALGSMGSGTPARAGFDATVTSCEATGTGDLSTATVGFTVTNTGTRTRTARVSIEYRDGSGNRIDTDTSYVRDIAPGDTARSSESTILDAAPDAGTRCVITRVS